MDLDIIYDMYFKDVFLYVLSLSKNKEIAEDITGETFLKALKNLDKFDGKKDIRAWLFTIAKNTFFTYAKRQNIYASCALDENINNSSQNVVLENILSNEQRLVIHKFLHSMDNPYKEVFSLRIFGELPFDDIGAIFGKSSGWARVTFFRAKKQILEHMEENNNE